MMKGKATNPSVQKPKVAVKSSQVLATPTSSNILSQAGSNPSMAILNKMNSNSKLQ
jgi:hypothetical protein